MLISPIILGDHPAIAPESAGDLFDATEIDEILTLRVMTMTERGEGRSARHRPASGRDPRALRRDEPSDWPGCTVRSEPPTRALPST